MSIKEIEIQRKNWLDKHLPYQMIRWDKFRYGFLGNVLYRRRPGSGNRESFNDVVIMADTETSKKPKSDENHVVAWTISIRAFERNICTLWGQTPSEFIKCVNLIIDHMSGDLTIIYFHNLAYDYVFLRKFMFAVWGYPIKQLATKRHYPIFIKFENGIILKDSLILAQRSLERWAVDMDVEHKKAVGYWDYTKLRSQHDHLTDDELTYIEHDTLAGVECLDKLRIALDKYIFSMPYTATGIPREDVRRLGNDNGAKEYFSRKAMTYELYEICQSVYHGGYTHANRHEIGFVNRAQCYDFASSYPYCLLAFKYPTGFSPIDNKDVDYICRNSNEYAFMFKFIAYNIRLKDDSVPMPVLQFSKCKNTINAILDNGRILCAAYVEIYLSEMDIMIVMDQYKWSGHICTDVYVSQKEYLPRYLTDYIFSLYEDKTKLKGGDPVLYALAKSKLNSVYGMMVQHSIQDELIEDYTTGDYITKEADPKKLYSDYLKNRNSILLYQWGAWCTAYAQYNLFQLGKCISGTWLYSDTDSCYATEWDHEKVASYNDHCKDLIKLAGYGCIHHNGREYWLGCAESDGDNDKYTEYVSLGAKRYCGRSAADGKLRITVAGVPKIGAEQLNDDIKNFKKGMIFSGSKTGKLTHTYIYKDEIYNDECGNETGDSINLTECDYLMDEVEISSWESLFREEIEIQVYDKGKIF